MATTTKTPPKLEDLSPEDRAALLEQAREQNTELDTLAAREAASDRDLRIRELLTAEQVHLRGCPYTETGRVEAFGAVRPAKPNEGIPATPVTSIRCLECGGAIALEGQPETYDL